MVFYFSNAAATLEIYTLSLHDALPISETAFTVNFTANFTGNGEFDDEFAVKHPLLPTMRIGCFTANSSSNSPFRSEEHTSELQSHHELVCRLLLEKKYR